MSEPVAWIKDTSLIALKRDESTVMAYPHDYLIRPAVPLYTADAIREAVERERQEIILVLKDELFSEEEVLFVKGYNGGIRNALEVIKARGAA